MHTFIAAEIGINHNGDLEIAKKLIDTAVIVGCDAVKFQKRTVETVFYKEFLEEPFESPFGTTRRDEKLGLEFSLEEFQEIDAYCKKKGIIWYASAWDVDSQLFLRPFQLPYNKIASAMLPRKDILEIVAEEGRYTFIATGMSSFDEIDFAVDLFQKKNCPFELMHCNSTYPMPDIDANLNMIQVLKNRYHCKVGYSGHEIGTLVSTCAVAAGATSIERHITLDKRMYGSDQPASMEPYELWKLVHDIRDTERIMGSGKKVLTEAELAMKESFQVIGNVK